MIETVIPKKVSDYYSSPVEVRFDSIFMRFKDKFNSKPDFVARAPGRVNIIG